MIDRATGEQLYPCADCGVLRTKAEGGTVFTVCDGCWDKHHPPCESIGAKLLSASREQLIEEVLRLRGELAACQHTSAVLLSAAERVAYSKLQLGTTLIDEDRESLRALIAAVAAHKRKDHLRGSGGGSS